ncbi:MAG: hypothetical protein K0R09_2012 [Clostridiales bacterium]|jgi:hypothetical protein|nr:hypothetical protein [Clostridiales bacterium]
MSSLNRFKSDADKIMHSINVSSELKEKTLKQLKVKKYNWTKLSLIPAACLTVVLMLVITPGSPLSKFYPKTQKGITNPGDTSNIMMLDPGNPGNNTSKQLNSLDEAKKYLDGAVLIPSYIPKGFKLDTIQAVSSKAGIVENIYLTYTLEDMTFIISMEKDKEWKDFSLYRDVDVNGATGHIKSYVSEQELSELRWFAGSVLYTVEGSLSEEQAIRIAQSLK